MIFLLDTNICSAYLKNSHNLYHYFEQYNSGICINSIVLAELYSWGYSRNDSGKLINKIETDLLEQVSVLLFDEETARIFGQIQGKLLKTGIVINEVDLMIAASAISSNLTLVTNNTKHFQPIPNLRIVDWLTS